jgi:hypothetical protein
MIFGAQEIDVVIFEIWSQTTMHSLLLHSCVTLTLLTTV